MAKVLILGEDARIVLPIYRSLGQIGVQVHTAWCPNGNPALRSHYIARIHSLPEYSQSSIRSLDGLRNLMAQEQFDLIIPATEAATYALHQHRADFQGMPNVFLPNSNAFKTVYDKAKTYELATRLGIPIPRTVRIQSLSGLDRDLQDLRSPFVIKPVCSVRAEEVTAKNYVRMQPDQEGAKAICKRLLTSGVPLLVQEMFEGVGKGVEVLANEGEILFAFSHRRLHETSGFGSTYRQSVPIDHRLLEAARKLMHELKYTGVAMVEFRVNESSSEWVLLEVNGRFWGSLPLAVAAGADFPRYLFEMLVEGRRAFPPAYRVGVRCRDLLNDCRWMWRSLRSRSNPQNGNEHKEGWEINRISRADLLTDIVRMFSLRDHADLFTWSDPAPAMAELGSLMKIAKGKLTRLLGKSDSVPA
jgi:predicted ATP-grasp superfamily ATP-dependent carboligase